MDRRDFIISVPMSMIASAMSPVVLKSEEIEAPKELNAVVAVWSDKYQRWFSYIEVDLTNKGFAFLNKISNRLSFCAVNGDSLDVHICCNESDDKYIQKIPLFKPELKSVSQSTLECIEAHCDDTESTENYTAVSFKYGELFGGIVV